MENGLQEGVDATFCQQKAQLVPVLKAAKQQNMKGILTEEKDQFREAWKTVECRTSPS